MTMMEHKRHWWEGVWGQIPAALSELPVLTAAEQTRLSWAKQLETPLDIPPVYAGRVTALADQAGIFPYCVLTPSYAGFLTHGTERLLCCPAGEIHVLEQVNGELSDTIYAQTAIDLMEFGTVLLKGWLKIVGTDSTGRHVVTMLKFNTVTDYLFTPILQQWRRAQGEQGTAVLAHEQAKFDYLTPDHYKFMSIARRVILPGDRVLAAIMQPELRTPLATLFGHAYTRFHAPACLVILTDRELIIAAEEDRSWWDSGSRYGSISTYIPLRKIADIAARALPDGSWQCTLQLFSGEQRQLDFTAAQTPDLARLINSLPAGIASISGPLLA
jgi:hypothetical protein